jgi:hypothetical protein
VKQALGSTHVVQGSLDPAMRMFFGYSPQLQDDFEECLFHAKKRIAAALPPEKRADHAAFDDALIAHFIENVTFDESVEWRAAPQLAIIHFFKRDTLSYPAEFMSSPDDVHLFVQALYRALVCPLEHCGDARQYRVAGAWTCPCFTKTHCGTLSRALQARLSVLQVAAKVAHMNNRGSILNHIYTCIDAHSRLLCAIHRRIVAAKGHRAAIQPLCSDAEMLPLLAENPISLEWSFTADSLPDTSSLLSLAISYNSAANGSSNKKIFQSKYPYLSAENLERMEKLHKLIYKGLPTRCFNRQLWNAIRRCCVLYYPKLRATRIDHEFVVFFFRIVIGAVLGVYRTAQKLDSIDARVQVYSAVHSEIPISSILDILTVGNKWTLLYIMREYLREMVSRSSGVLEALRKVYNWDANIAFIDRITAIMREQVRMNLRSIPNYAPHGDWASCVFRGVDMRIQSLHNTSRGTQREKTIDYDLYAINKHNRDMCLKKYEADMALQGEFLGKEFLLKRPRPVMMKKAADGTMVRAVEKEETMRRVIATFSKSQFVPLDWLVCFGAKWSDVIAVRAALTSKMAGFVNIMTEMRKRDPDSFVIFLTFFRLCKEHQDYRVYRGDAFMHLQHAAALNRVHKVKLGGRIPRVYGKLYVCPSCKDFKRVSFFKPMRRGKSTGGASICRFSGRKCIVCGRKHKAASWRELQKVAEGKEKKRRKTAPAEKEPEAAVDPEMDEEAAMERCARFFYGQADDNFDPLNDIKMDVIDENEACDDADFLPATKPNVKKPSERVRMRSLARHIDMQHTLKECHDKELLELNMLGSIVTYERNALTLCFRCAKPMPLLQATHSGLMLICGECADKEEATAPAVKIKCEAFQCMNKTLPLSDAYIVQGYDDTNADPTLHRYRPVILCDSHHALSYIKSAERVLSVKYLLGALAKNYGTYGGPNGSFVPVVTEDEL